MATRPIFMLSTDELLAIVDDEKINEGIRAEAEVVLAVLLLLLTEDELDRRDYDASDPAVIAEREEY